MALSPTYSDTIVSCLSAWITTEQLNSTTRDGTEASYHSRIDNTSEHDDVKTITHHPVLLMAFHLLEELEKSAVPKLGVTVGQRGGDAASERQRATQKNWFLVEI